jgi:amino acid adenylation domain-containing protein
MSAKVHEVFEARTPTELAARYDEWAASYEGDMGDHGGPLEAVEALARYVPVEGRILDAGCGTGITGALLSDRGYRHLEGLDISEGMLREAGKKGCYTALHRQALGETLDFPAATFDAVLVVGVFARSHAPSRSLAELVRVTKPGGHIIFTLRPEFYLATDFKDTMASLAEAHRWRLEETTEPFDGRYKEFPGIRLQVWIYKVASHESSVPVPAEWNQTAASYPTDQCIHHLFEEQVKRTPGAPALIFEDRQLTYTELNTRADQLANHLRGLGAGPGTLIGICVRRSPDMLIGMLGVLKSGAAYVALDPNYPRVRLVFMIDDADMSIVLTQKELVDDLPLTGARIICLDSEWDAISAAAQNNASMPSNQRDLAYILYTSGSTGRPKGVAIQHHSVVVFLSWAHSVFSREELSGTLAGTSICFDLSVFEIFAPLTCGGTVILAENVVALPSLAARGQVTLINTVPSAMTALVQVDGVPDSVRVVNLAGEPLPNKLVQDVYQLGVDKVYNLYGPSEDTTYSTYVLTDKGAASNPTIGRPISNTQAYIVDESLQLTGIGVAGELCLGGDGLASGYLKRPALTDAKFIPNPFGSGRLYRTGDLARWLPDGNIEFLGRMDHQVKVRGFRIELGEIETALEQFAGVDRAAVLALPDAKGELQLLAYVVANSTAVETLARDQDSQEHVALWKNVYEETYRQAPAAADPTFDTSGWQSSYTGQPIPAGEMHEWLAQTIERIMALRPQNVLEIGCGTGMLVARVAPHCASYVGLDFSSTALDHIRAMQRTVAGLERVSLFERSADDLAGFAPQSFDTVIINSVAQHFPDADYLMQVLTGAVALIKPGGHMLIGDVLNLSLLEAFHTSVQLYRADDQDTCVHLKQRIYQQIEQERDLMLAPAFFTAAAREISTISHVEAIPKRGPSLNQLTRFRYDVVLHIGESAEPPADLSWLDWRKDKLSINELGIRLSGSWPETLAIRNIPNVRLDQESAALAWLREADSAETMRQLRANLAQHPRTGVEPGDLLAFESLGYRVELSWLNTDALGTYDAVLTRSDMPVRPAAFLCEAAGGRPWRDYANHPQRAKLNRQLIPQLREFLREKLPQYMMPAVFTVLEKMPLSPAGKIDRRALAQLPVNVVDADAPVAGLHSPIEKVLVEAWAEALNLSHIRTDDDFFELGGNSLKAMALTHNLQRRFNHTFRPVVLLQAPTVSRFAAYLQKTHPDLTTELTTVMQEGEI